MSKITVNGVELAHEVIGNGSPVVWTNGGWLPRGVGCYLHAGRFSSNHSVLIWDRRNCGESDVALDEDSPSEFHSYAHDLHEVLHALNMVPAIVGGGLRWLYHFAAACAPLPRRR